MLRWPLQVLPTFQWWAGNMTQSSVQRALQECLKVRHALTCFTAGAAADLLLFEALAKKGWEMSHTHSIAHICLMLPYKQHAALAETDE